MRIPQLIKKGLFIKAKYSIILLLSLALFARYKCSAPQNKQGAEVYIKYCAGCHGPQLQGSRASSLIKENLIYGNNRNSILETIRNGIPKTEMIKWSSALSNKDIEAVTDFILAVREHQQTVKTDVNSLKIESRLYKLKIERVITEGLIDPWAIEFVDANRALITGRSGRLYWMVNNKLDTQKITGLPKVYYLKENYGGLFDLALDPDYKNKEWVYLSFAHTMGNFNRADAAAMTKVVRGKIKGHNWVEEQTLFEVHDSLRITGGLKWGSRLLFDKNGYLYFTIGDMMPATEVNQSPQMLSRPEGKILRIRSDGSIPEDNPYYGRKDVLHSIYGLGTRNVQGLAQNPLTGKIYFSDHGPQGGDELNVLKKGANYGWPLVTYGINYDFRVISKDTLKAGMEQPLTYWTPSIAVCPVEFASGSLFTNWQNNLFVGALKFEEVRRLVMDGDRITEQEIILKGYGRVRDIKFGPDGALYVLTNMPDALLRITPQ